MQEREYCAVRGLGLAMLVLALSTLAALALRPYVAATNLVMPYLVGVVAVASQCDRRIAVLTSFLSVAAFDFFCVAPYYTFRVHDYEYLITFAAMLVVALVISTQTARVRGQALEAKFRQAHSDVLYQLSRRVAGESRVFEVARAAAEYASDVFGTRSVIFIPEDGRISFTSRSSDWLPVPKTEEMIAQAVFDTQEKAGRGTDRSPDATALYLPLKGGSETSGVMALLNAGEAELGAEQTRLLEAFAHQTAIAMERTRSRSIAEAARIQVKTEQMRSSLLSAVSHDLRTPLASITGAASTLRAQGDRLSSNTRHELLDSIADEAERLNRLVGNLLDMTRLECGVQLRRDLVPLEEIVGSALQRIEGMLSPEQVTTYLPENLPLVPGDDVLLGQLLINLLENAAKYAPKGRPIEIAAEATDRTVAIEVRDRGPGLAPGDEQRIFEKFYRGRSENKSGAGLGLAICRAITEAHGGSIQAFNREGGGAVFRIRLPLGTGS